MKFSRQIFITIIGLVVLVIAGSAAAITWVMERNANREVELGLARAEKTFLELESARGRRLALEAEVVSEEPRLKAVVATSDIDHATVVGVAGELQRATNAQLFVVTDIRGRLLADTASPESEGDDLTHLDGVAAAIADGSAEATWNEGDNAFVVHAHRVSFGPRRVGVLIVGERLDGAALQSAADNTGSTVAIFIDNTLSAEASPQDGQAIDATGLILGGSGTARVKQRGRDFLVAGGTYPGSKLRYELVRSLDEALLPARHLLRLLLGLLLGAVVVAVVAANALSRRIAGPLTELAGFSARIGGGDLATRVPVRGPSEVQALAGAMNQMAVALAASQETLVSKERLERELEIATRIQTALVPADPRAIPFSMAAAMIPATEVGGDYYDVLPTQDGCWIGIGDVAGHGLQSGLVMLMAQSVISAVAHREAGSPRAVLLDLNRVIFDNVRQRLRQDEHMTLTLLRVTADGRMVFAGAHEDIIICKASGETSRLPTPGTWVGGMEDISPFTVDTSYALARGDLMVLYTDGITEAMNTEREQFGIARLEAAVRKSARKHVSEARDAILAEVRAWMHEQEDDITLLLVRYEG